MPTYEYKCTICEERFEVEQSIKDKALTTIAGADDNHPKNKHPVKKVFHAPGIAFKGSGFYKNDSSTSKPKSSSSSSDSSGSDTKSSDTKSSDTKTSDSKTSVSKSSDPKPTSTTAATAGTPASS